MFAVASLCTSARLDALNAGATNRDLAPLRITTQCVPTRVPRRYKVSVRARCRLKAEGVCEPLRRIEVRLLELQPRQVLDLDHRVLRPAGAVTPLGPFLAVQVFVRCLDVVHYLIPSPVLMKVST